MLKNNNNSAAPEYKLNSTVKAKTPKVDDDHPDFEQESVLSIRPNKPNEPIDFIVKDKPATPNPFSAPVYPQLYTSQLHKLS